MGVCTALGFRKVRLTSDWGGQWLKIHSAHTVSAIDLASRKDRVGFYFEIKEVMSRG